MNTDHHKERLEEEKAKLEAEMQSVGRKSATVPDDWEAAPVKAEAEADLIDQADIATGRDTDAAVLADLEARYDAVLDALRRIDQGTYGRCAVCGEPIGEARLAANPAATTCAVHMV